MRWSKRLLQRWERAGRSQRIAGQRRAAVWMDARGSGVVERRWSEVERRGCWSATWAGGGPGVALVPW